MARYRMKPCRGKGNSISTQCNTLGVSTGHSRDREHKLRQWTPDACLVTDVTTLQTWCLRASTHGRRRRSGTWEEISQGSAETRGTRIRCGKKKKKKKKTFLQMSFQN
jgi:hypothetical protein